MDIEQRNQRYIEKNHPHYVKACQDYLQLCNGPYLLGEQISYADILMYGAIYDETPALCKIKEGTPLHRFYRVVGEQPNIKAYIKNWEVIKPSLEEYGIVQM
jgi:glutathione S-transferase